MTKSLVLPTILTFLLCSFALALPQSSLPGNTQLQPQNLPAGSVGAGQVSSLGNDLNNFNLENVEIVEAGQEQVNGSTVTVAEIDGKNNQGEAFTLEYLQVENQTPGNSSDLEYINLQGKDPAGEPFDAEILVIQGQNAQGQANLTAVNVTGVYQGKPFDVTYAQLQGNTDGESLNIEVAEIEGFDPQGEQFDLTVTNMEYVAADGEATDGESVVVTYIPSGRKPVQNSGKPIANIGKSLQHSGRPVPNGGRSGSAGPVRQRLVSRRS